MSTDSVLRSNVQQMHFLLKIRTYVRLQVIRVQEISHYFLVMEFFMDFLPFLYSVVRLPGWVSYSILFNDIGRVFNK